MSSYSERDTYSQAGDWLLGTVRRNPEALLLMAAGCCLMMRSSSRMSAHRAQRREEWDYPTGRASSEVGRASASAREGFSRATDATSDTARSAGDYASQVKDRIAETASDYASQIKDRISDTASSYADTVKDFADDARRAVTERRYEAQIVLRDMKHCAFRFRIGQLVRYGARFFSALVPMLWTAENGFHGPMPQ
jgi:hypothetical protein